MIVLLNDTQRSPIVGSDKSMAMAIGTKKAGIQAHCPNYHWLDLSMILPFEVRYGPERNLFSFFVRGGPEAKAEANSPS